MEEDDFFKPQSPEEEILFAGDRPPTDPNTPPVETPAPAPEKAKETETPPAETKESKDVPGSSPDSADKPDANGVSKPSRAKDEPDWRYNLRVKIWEGGKQALKAETPEEKGEARKKVEDARRELQTKSREHHYKPSKEDDEVLANEYKDPALLAADEKRVLALGNKAGFASKDDVRNEVSQVLQEEREKGVQNTALNDFFDEYPEIYGDEKNRDVFFDTVEKYFNYSGKGYDELRFMFDSTHKALYPETLEDTIAKSEVLKDKMLASSFGGGSAAEAKPKDQEKENIIKDYAAKGEDVSWFVND